MAPRGLTPTPDPTDRHFKRPRPADLHLRVTTKPTEPDHLGLDGNHSVTASMPDGTVIRLKKNVTGLNNGVTYSVSRTGGARVANFPDLPLDRALKRFMALYREALAAAVAS